MEVEWLSFELRPAPAALPRQHYPGSITPAALPWRRCPGGAARIASLVHPRSLARPMRDRVYELARARPEPRGRDPRSPYQARSTLAPALHSFAEERGRGRAHREAAHHALFVAG